MRLVNVSTSSRFGVADCKTLVMIFEARNECDAAALKAEGLMSERLTTTLKILSTIILAAAILLGALAFIQRIPVVATTLGGKPEVVGAGLWGSRKVATTSSAA